MSDKLFPFSFESHEVRVVVDDNGDPLFVARDVAEALGYANCNDAVIRHCKGVVKRETLETPGGAQELRVIGEPDLYRLIFGSTLPSAQAFEALVVDVILPTIRKTGKYEAPSTTEPAVIMPTPVVDPPACLTWRVKSAISDYATRATFNIRQFIEDDMAKIARELVRRGYSGAEIERRMQDYEVNGLQIKYPSVDGASKRVGKD